MTSARPDPALDALLQCAFGRPVSAIPIPVPLGYGERGMAFRLSTDDGGVPPRVLLLRYPPAKYQTAVHTFNVLRALQSHTVAAPNPYYLNWTFRERWLGLLVEYAEGRSLSGNPFPFFIRIGHDFAAQLARLHRLKWHTQPDVPTMPLRYIMDDLSQQAYALRTPELDIILSWLRPRLTYTVEQPYTLIHGDYRLEHVIAQGTQVALIYGWESAVLADPRFDVGFASAMLSAHSITLSNQFVEAYTAEAGPVPDLAVWETINALRILTRVATTLSTLPEVQRNRFLQSVVPMWQGVLAFVESRTGLPLVQI